MPTAWHRRRPVRMVLGFLFLTGSGVTQSGEEARKWIGRAAQQGHADARAYLAAAP
jgi:TPR repeat protein